MTQAGPERWCWPDGGTYLKQPAITVWVFSAFDRAVFEEMKTDG